MSDLIKENDAASEKDEESPILTAQRYLNIFHQIHIFNTEKKAEFNKSLLQMDDKIKKLLVNMPGGKVLLEHLKEIEDAQGVAPDETLSLIAQNIEEEKKAAEKNKKKHNINVTVGELAIGNEFAEKLATSLVEALKNANLATYTDQTHSLRTIPLFGSTTDDGHILISKYTILKLISCPLALQNKSSVYAVKLNSNCVGLDLSDKAIFYIDKSELVGSGDLALYFFNKAEAELVKLDVNERGQLYGLRNNPEEKILFTINDIAKIHKVVLIGL